MSRWGLTAAQKNKARSRYKEIKEEPKVKAAPGSKEAAAEAAAAKKKKMRMKPKKRRKWKAPKPPRMTELISRLAPISSKDAPSNEEMKKYAEKVLQWSAVYVTALRVIFCSLEETAAVPPISILSSRWQATPATLC